MKLTQQHLDALGTARGLAMRDMAAGLVFVPKRPPPDIPQIEGEPPTVDDDDPDYAERWVNPVRSMEFGVEAVAALINAGLLVEHSFGPRKIAMITDAGLAEYDRVKAKRQAAGT